MDNESYIIEYVKNGDYVKVSAIHPNTGKEVCVVCPSQGVTKKQMEELAIRKMRYVMNKEKLDS